MQTGGEITRSEPGWAQVWANVVSYAAAALGPTSGHRAHCYHHSESGERGR